MCLFFWNSTYLLNERNVFIKCTQAVLYAIFIVYCSTDFEKFTPHCYEPYPSAGLFIYMVIVILILPAAFLVICVVSFLVLFCPCLSYTLWRAWYDGRERAQMKEKVVKNLSRIAFDARKFKQSKECAICFVEFKEDDMITPLSCDIKHYFHTECIERWIKVKNECPLCRAEIKPRDLLEFQREVDRLLDE